MPHDPGSARHVDKKMKMVGLGRLRWYLSERECFKQHTLSESHNIGNVNETINNISQQFQAEFLDQLRTSHREKSVHSNRFYQTYIANKHHTHLNATRWHSLTDFVKFLGREGLCRVEEKDDGLFIAWINRSPEALRRAADSRKRDQAEAADQMREEDLIQAQIARAHAQTKVTATAATPETPESAPTSIEPGRTVGFQLPASRSSKEESKMSQGKKPLNVFKAAKQPMKRKRTDSPIFVAPT
ncbi:KIN17-like protein [Colletotrichum gloeosporioides]|uniref:KIN17-like protein n=1 Tax=Colletotrichum gloeosporioides TaxID=474922 RepID=A0A8H4C349_COLGL|nr:KIN17-like protein [Colletotrichum gloeosporioides]KAF3797171.1 KIN17-like protein [Colletotrichum gloeosporioides]